MLLTKKNYTQEAIDIAKQVSNEVEIRHAKWLASMSHSVDQSQVDQILSLQGRYCEDVIFNEDERITRHQRILLMCEQERVKEKRQKAAYTQITQQNVIGDITKVAENMLITKLQSQPIDLLCRAIPEFNQFASFAYSPSLSFTKLSLLATNSHQLKSTIIDFIANSRLGDRMSRHSKSGSDVKVAIGQIGIENCRMLFPVLMARSMLKWTDKNTQLLVPKFWQQLVVTANVTRMRLEDARVNNPDAGVLIGVLRSLGSFVIINHFTPIFEDALIEVMLSYRNSNRREEYYACADIKAHTACLPKVLHKLEAKVTLDLLESFDWPANSSYIKTALLEDLDQIPVAQRSDYGAALAQARAYAIYDGLARSELFYERHKPFWFANVQISGEALKAIRANAPGKMTLAF
ncbi:HDOD domain-containing protein [Vibrio alfacsensis]|uniref:HDOD domain-containing protein n=1 Tax=Vibrio alfacsensis TaxID=1074311 RepID=UPI004068774C